MFIVFKVRGKKNNLCYYGYSNQIDNLIEAFMTGATRPEPDRGDVRFLHANGDKVENLDFEIIAEFETEVEAWLCRNDMRAGDALAFTGPTMFPSSIASRIKKTSPEKMHGWQQALVNRKARETAITARQAYAAGQWTTQQIKSLLNNHKREQVVCDLDTCTPTTFAKKYALYV